MSIDDDDLDTALRGWGEKQRQDASEPPTPPAIADLLGDRRRSHNLVAVVATVGVVVVLAIGLGMGLWPDNHSSATQGVTHGGPPTTKVVGGPAKRLCWQSFADAGSRYDRTTGTEIAVLRYTGTASCRIADNPQLALVNRSRDVVGPHAPPRTLSRFVTVHPGETVRATIRVPRGCLATPIPNGHYSVLIAFRPSPHLSPAHDPLLPLGRLTLADDVGCPEAALTTGLTTHFAVLDGDAAATLARLTRIAHREAVADGDPSATAQAVLTTRGRIATLGLVQLVGPQARIKMWIMQLRGHFTGDACAQCLGGPIQIQRARGTEQLLTLSEPGLRIIRGQTTDHAEDLSKLGRVVTLIP